MKIKNILLFLAGVVVYLLFVVVLKSWDNRDMHMYLNEFMMQKFLSKVNDFENLEGYEFDLTTKLEGDAITQSDLEVRITGTQEKTVLDWVIHGGYSCDEPEAYQALRHFYDPVGIDGGKKYLTDINYEKLVSLFSGGNPNIDAVEWALEDQGNITNGGGQLTQEFSWKDGKFYLHKAFQEKDEDVRMKNMALAWRSLGEVLHLYGDMGLPCHVRNDGHPPYYTSESWYKKPGEWLDKLTGVWGEPDPVEDLIRSKAQSHGNPSGPVVEEISKHTSARDMFVSMATFTNANFPSQHTLTGSDWVGLTIKPKIRKNNPYPTPFVSSSGSGWSYDQKNFTYSYNVNGETVKMCKDLFYFNPSGSYHSNFLTIDNECASSQASVLVPTVISSGAYLIARFFPKFEVDVETVIEPITREIIVTAKHIINEEYKSEIKYNGKIEVFVNRKKLYTENAKDGILRIENAILNAGDVVEARMVCGGIIINSYKSDFEMRVIKESGELRPDQNDIELTIPSSAKYGENIHIEGKWGQNIGLYPEATYTIIAGWVKDTTQLWTLGSFDEIFYQPGPSPHHYFRLDIPVPNKPEKKYFKLQMSLKASTEDQKYWLQGRIYKIPVK